MSSVIGGFAIVALIIFFGLGFYYTTIHARKIEDYLTETKGKPVYWMLSFLWCFVIFVGLYGLGTYKFTGLLWGKREIESQGVFVTYIVFYGGCLGVGLMMAFLTLRKIRYLSE